MIVNCYIGNVLPQDAEPTKSSDEYGCSACEYIKDNKLNRCSNYVTVKRFNADGEITGEDSKCANAWNVELSIEFASKSTGIALGQTAAIEDLRNETVQRQEHMIKLASAPVKDIKLVSG